MMRRVPEGGVCILIGVYQYYGDSRETAVRGSGSTQRDRKREQHDGVSRDESRPDQKKRERGRQPAALNPDNKRPGKTPKLWFSRGKRRSCRPRTQAPPSAARRPICSLSIAGHVSQGWFLVWFGLAYKETQESTLMSEKGRRPFLSSNGASRYLWCQRARTPVCELSCRIMLWGGVGLCLECRELIFVSSACRCSRERTEPDEDIYASWVTTA